VLNANVQQNYNRYVTQLKKTIEDWKLSKCGLGRSKEKMYET